MKANQELMRHGYDPNQFRLYPELEPMEVAAKIHKGDASFYSKFTPEEMAGWMVDYYRQVIKAAGPEAVKGLQDPILTNERSMQLMRDVYERANQPEQSPAVNPRDIQGLSTPSERSQGAGQGRSGGPQAGTRGR